MLDDKNVLQKRDPQGALVVAQEEWFQLLSVLKVSSPSHDGRRIDNIVIAGLGGSSLAADLAVVYLKDDVKTPLEVVRSYNLPNYVNKNTLVIISSYSGNTEESISCFEQAIGAGAQIAITASGGILLSKAADEDIAHVKLTEGISPRMAVILNLRAVTALLVNFNLIHKNKLYDLEDAALAMQEESINWQASQPVHKNYAKQLALLAVGKTAIFYGGELTWPVAYKWKISWNENAKNLAFCGQYPEVNHNEFIGWTSHPIDKPFAIFDIRSSFESDKINKRFEISDRLLSGRRPKSTPINLVGNTLISQLLWGSVLADFVSIYLAILNNVNPTKVDLIENLKAELIKD